MQNTSSQNITTTTPARRDIQQQVTDTIIKQLEAGTVPWNQPWIGGEFRLPGLPKNFVSGNKYKGINILLLWGSSIEQEFSSTEWATFKQWSEKKECIRKGEKGSMIVYYDTLEREVDGEIKKIPFLKSSVVFNRCQLASFVPEVRSIPQNLVDPVSILYRVEEFVDNTKATVAHVGSSACYNRSDDVIYMPDMDKFISTDKYSATEAYYFTLLHELHHWAGAPKRLNRTKGKKFGDADYALEELTAELGAAFLSSELEITTPEKADHASYIAGWLKALKDDKQFIFRAASEASKSVEYLHGLQPENPVFA